MTKSLFEELKRRNVFKVGAAYVIVSWLILQVLSSVVPIIEAPEWVSKFVLLLLVIGLPIALIFAWAFEMTPDGIKKESEVNREDSITQTTSQKINFIIIGSLALIIGGFVYDKFSSDVIEKGVANTIYQNQNATEYKSLTRNSKIKGVNLIDKLVSKASIAALPFENRSPDKNDAFFAAGIHDDLLTHLANFKAFKVISRTSVLEYKNTTKNIKQIGEELGVENILEGAVQRAGNRVRINVQLIDAKTDKHLWAKIYDRKLTTDNLFDIQSEISKAIAAALKTTLAPHLLEELSIAPTQNLQAYDLYLQARQFISNNSANNYQIAIDLLHQALKLDSQFKQAWIGLAEAQIGFYWYSQGEISIRDQALHSLKQAEALDPDYPDLAKIYGLYYYWGFLDYPKAANYLNKALSKRPNDDNIYTLRGWVLRRGGHWQEAILSLQKSLELNPRDYSNWSTLAETYSYLHRYTEASTTLQKSKLINDTDPWLSFFSAYLSLQLGDIKFAESLSMKIQFNHDREITNQFIYVQLFSKNYQKALNKVNQITDAEEIWRQSIFLRDDYRAQIYYFKDELDDAKKAAQTALIRLTEKSITLGADYRLYLPQARMAAILGQPDKVKTLIQQSIQLSPKDAITELTDRYEYARIFAMAGMLDETIKTLEPQLTPPSFTSPNYVKIDPAFDKIRDKPEFKAMLARHPQAMGSAKKEANQ